MGQVSEALFELADIVIEQFQLNEDDFEQVQTIILENHLLGKETQEVFNYFRDIVLCPQCLSLLGTKCPCREGEVL